MEHFIKQCLCGALLETCRCPALDKAVTIVEKGCTDCQHGPYPTNEDSRLFKQLLKEALQVQDACNLSGIAKSFANVMTLLWRVDRQNQNLGTGWVNSNSVTRLWTCKLTSLSGLDTQADWTAANNLE